MENLTHTVAEAYVKTPRELEIDEHFDAFAAWSRLPSGEPVPGPEFQAYDAGASHGKGRGRLAGLIEARATTCGACGMGDKPFECHEDYVLKHTMTSAGVGQAFECRAGNINLLITRLEKELNDE